MAIGQRIRFFRNRKGMTQKQLGEILGFLGKTSDVRMAQYESEARTPKQDLLKEMAGILGVSPYALNVPDIDTYFGLIHTLFALEDMYGMKIDKIDGELCLHFDKSVVSSGSTLYDMLESWQKQSAKLEAGEITKEEYDEWRYKYPEFETSHHFAKVIPQGLSDMLMDALKKEEAKEKKETNKRKKK